MISRNGVELRRVILMEGDENNPFVRVRRAEVGDPLREEPVDGLLSLGLYLNCHREHAAAHLRQ